MYMLTIYTGRKYEQGDHMMTNDKIVNKTTKCQDEIIFTVQDYNIYSSYIFKPTICKERKYVNKKNRKERHYVKTHNMWIFTIRREGQYLMNDNICTNRQRYVQTNITMCKSTILSTSPQ